MFRNLFKKIPKRKYGGLIAFHNLEDFWDSLLPEEKEFIRDCYASAFSTGNRNPKHLDDPKVQITSTQSASGFLWGYSSLAISRKNFVLAEKLLIEAIKRKTNNIDLHFTYNQLIDLCYTRIDESPEWLERCIEYCLEDIKIFPDFKKEYLQEERARRSRLADSPFIDDKERKTLFEETENNAFDLQIPSFHRLAIIYENQGKYEEAIDICELAISYGLKDGTQSGYEGRIARLTKKAQSGEQNSIN
ncbi:MAG: hypothetical protein ACOX0T_03600 [Pelotomaculum sp.]|jgi:tetratricopeptide (TPR) repeat protein